MISVVNEFLDDLRYDDDDEWQLAGSLGSAISANDKGGRMAEAPIVSVEQGQLQGRIVSGAAGKSFYSFQGIPYAKPPLGSLRFQAPQPPEPWDGVRDATSEGNVTAQMDFVKNEYIGDENCLFLNVYTPNLDGAFLPVMIYVHGGGFKFGSGNTDFYGPDYLLEKDVVVVTLNYRCGVLGFLGLNTPEVPGNAGLKDVVQAIKWVKNNIENFGGNSGNITVFGESAGGAAVSLLTVSPTSRNLISKAIIQSGTGISDFALQKTPVENARLLAKTLGCESDDPEEILDFLRACSAKELVEAHDKINPKKDMLESMNIFSFVIEKEFSGVEAFLSEPFRDFLTSGRVADIPIMIGTCAVEFAIDKKIEDFQFFIPEELNIKKDSVESLEIADKFKQLYIKDDAELGTNQLLTDRYFRVDTFRIVEYLIQVTNKPVYCYRFDYVGGLNLYGKLYKQEMKYAGHMDDLGYLFKNDFQTDLVISEEDKMTRERMVRLWTNFAKSGNPTPEENHYLTVNWLPVTKDNLYYLNIGSELTLGINPDKEKIEYWNSLYTKYYRIWEEPKATNEEIPVKPDPPVVVGSFTETVTYSSSSFTESSEYISERTEIVTESSTIADITETTTEVTNGTVEVSELINTNEEPAELVEEPAPIIQDPTPPVREPTPPVEIPTPAIEEPAPKIPEPTPVFEKPVVESPKLKEPAEPVSLVFNNYVNGDRKGRTSNEVKMVTNSNGAPKEVIRANDPPEDDLPKNIGVNKFVNFFESLGGKK